MEEILQDVTTIVDELTGNSTLLPSRSVLTAPEVSEGLEAFIRATAEKQETEEAFAVFDLAAVKRRVHTWRAGLPRVQPCYAVKCNPDRRVLRLLAEFGASFDCASQGELELMADIGVKVDHEVIFANPCKLPSHIKYAKSVGCKLTTFDTESELHKIKDLFPEMELVLRIRADDITAACPLGNKYGAEREAIGPLLQLAKQLQLEVVGICFHVGSGATNPEAFRAAICSARDAWDEGLRLGFKLRLLDLGGGWSGSSDIDGALMGPVAKVVNAALDEYFPPKPGFRVTAEPGRFFAEACVTIVVNLFGVRQRQALVDGKTQVLMDYWISDGVYGTFNCVIYDHAKPLPVPLFMTPTPIEQRPIYRSTIFGPTCDGLDRLPDTYDLPLMCNGDWLMFPGMGAYTVAAGSDFNGYKIVEMKRFYVWSEARQP